MEAHVKEVYVPCNTIEIHNVSLDLGRTPFVGPGDLAP